MPGDADCLFHAIAYQLHSVGHDMNASTFRQIVTSYLSEHKDEYNPFVHQPVRSNDGCSADNESIDAEDEYSESLSDPVVQRELRWQKYVRRMREGAWGTTLQ